ncbi:MAG: phosphoribosylglycinamide formyltransferase [Nitrospinota bacterium]|nr:phosphoribosylglycinamide formyltransferase [Nitrospinota bacterium]
MPPKLIPEYAVLASGRGSNLQALLEAVTKNIVPYFPRVVLSDNLDAKALTIAAEHGIETVFLDPKKHKGRIAYGEGIKSELASRGVEYICLAGFMRILGENVVAAFPNRIINIHPSLLPSFPGLEAQRQALDAGVEESGCTVHFVDSGVDTGPIIMQAKVKVNQNDSVQALSERILEQEHLIYPKVISALLEKRITIKNGVVTVHNSDGRKD